MEDINNKKFSELMGIIIFFVILSVLANWTWKIFEKEFLKECECNK